MAWGRGEDQRCRGVITLTKASIRVWGRALQCPGFCLPSCCLELGSPPQPSGAVLPSVSPQLVAGSTSSRSGNAARPAVPSCGTSVLWVILVFPSLYWYGKGQGDFFPWWLWCVLDPFPHEGFRHSQATLEVETKG